MKFHSNPVESHEEAGLCEASEGGTLARVLPPTFQAEVRAFVASVGDWRSESHQQAQGAEILGLVEARGHAVVGFESLRLRTPHPRAYLGSGRASALGEQAREAGATLLVLDAQLSPSQTRNLEDLTGLSVCDRELVILGVFQEHARTRMARIQVEIAHLEYLRPRIRGLGLDMDQQAGGIMNGRGAGETASELLARQLDGRLAQLRRSFEKLEASAGHRRRHREACARIALVGYTNAGKTSLMNGLTGAGLSSRARPFETLETTTRSLTRRGGSVLINDTVGFIRNLPDRLLASFSSTLAEVAEASLLVLVVDVSDPEWGHHLEVTRHHLRELDAENIPQFVVFNKADRVDEIHEESLRASVSGPFVVMSSLDEQAVKRLREQLIAQARQSRHARVEIFVAYDDPDLSRDVYRLCHVVEAHAEATGLRLKVEGDRIRIAGLLQRAGRVA